MWKRPNKSMVGVGGSQNDTASYTFSFNVAPVPEPASVCVLALLPAIVVGSRVRRRSS